MDRDGVYRAISSEREYQKKWDQEGFEEANSVGDYIAYARNYLGRAANPSLSGWDGTRGEYDRRRMTDLRKVAAIIVAAGERFGMPER